MRKRALVPEESIAIRVTAGIMVILGITAACSFGDSQFPVLNLFSLRIPLVLLLIWMALCGGYVSYQYRSGGKWWLLALVMFGSILALGGLLFELIWQLQSAAPDLMAPIGHFLGALLTLHMFWWRSRANINIGVGLATVALCVTANGGRSIVFGALTLLFLTVGFCLLFLESYEAMRRSAGSSAVRVRGSRPLPIDPWYSPALQRVLILPILSVLLFLFVPRLDGLADSVMSSLRGTEDLANTKASISEIPEALRSKPRSKEGSGELAHPDAANAGNSGDAGGANPNRNSTKNVETSSPGTDQTSPAGNDVGDSTGTSGGGQSAENGSRNSTSGQLDLSAKAVPDAQLDTAGPPPNMEELLFTVSASRSTYLRTCALDVFDGRFWAQSEQSRPFHERPIGPADFAVVNCPAVQLLKGVPTVQISQSLEFKKAIGPMLPYPGIPQRISIRARRLNFNKFGAVFPEPEVGAGQTVLVVSSLPVLNSDKLREKVGLFGSEERRFQSVLSNYLQMPRDQSARTVNLARELAGGGNWYERAERLSSYLRTNGHYSLTQRPVSEGNLTDAFLQSGMTGDCKDFGSAFVVMCRANGIPARLVAGYAPGELNWLTGKHEIRQKHAHIWSEIYLPGHGWIPFDATPQGVMPGRTNETQYGLLAVAESLSAGTEAGTQAESGSIGSVFKQAGSITSVAIQLLAGILASGTIFYTLLKVWMWYRKWCRARADMHPATVEYQRVLRKLKSVGLTFDESLTPDEVVSMVRTHPNFGIEQRAQVEEDLYSKMQEFVDKYAQSRFGNRPSAGLKPLGDAVIEQCEALKR